MRRAVLGAVSTAAALLASCAASAAAGPIRINLGAGQFPARTVVVSGLQGGTWNSAKLHLTENGHPVRGESVESVSRGGKGELGVVLVVDRSPSMAGAPSTAALRAAQAFAAQTANGQALGLVAFNTKATLVLPLTTNQASITQAVAQLPPIGPGTHILPALSLAIRQLAAAPFAARAVILLSDGADREPNGALTANSVAAQARASHVQIFTVGLRDAAYTPSSMRRLAQIGGGQFVEALGTQQVSDIFTRIGSGLRASWLIRYTSQQPPGGAVTVVLHADGVPGTASLHYQAPAAPATVPAPVNKAHARPFWTTRLALILIVALCAAILAIPVAVLVRHRAGPDGVTERVDAFVAALSKDEVLAALPQDFGANRTSAFLARASWWPRFVEALDIAMIAQSPERLVLFTAGAAALVGFLLTLALGNVLGLLLALVTAPLGLRAYVQFQLRRQRSRFTDQLPSHLEEISVSIRSGRSLIEAVNVVVAGADEPVHREFERALADENLGRPLEQTLRSIATRMESESIEQVAVVAAMHRRTGSSVSEALDRVAEGARERADLQRELRTLTAQGRLARWILTFLPPVILLIMQIISPHYVRPLLHTTAGIVALLIASGMVVLGSLVMKRIVNIEV